MIVIFVQNISTIIIIIIIIKCIILLPSVKSILITKSGIKGQSIEEGREREKVTRRNKR